MGKGEQPLGKVLDRETGEGDWKGASALRGLKKSTEREKERESPQKWKEMFTEKRKGRRRGGRKKRKKEAIWGSEGTQEERWGKKRDKKQSK